MIVYVETNFVLEHALEQEECDTCAEIIGLASAGQLRLVVPAFSLAEPHYAIYGKAKSRSRLERIFASTSANSGDTDAIVRFLQPSMHWRLRSSPALNLSVKGYDEQSRSWYWQPR
jgi:hypothetical protein